ncbi:pyruvate oxidase [Barrientosiimonas marina]|uniref:Pyruvate oxidase n=1 Tax=Lentibacillus kimchii TaxID=1542911 RepID=A0ABW2UT87_9BACI
MFDNRTGEVMADLLIDWDVNRIYGMPGNSINEFMDDLRKKEDAINFVQIRHEEVGALAASSYAKLTGKLGVCSSIAGPGGIHLLNGLYDAKKDRVPVLAIVGQVPSDDVGTDTHQEINLERMFDGVAVYNRRAETATHLPDMLNTAIRMAYTHRSVSVLIVPDDLFAAKQKQDKKKLTNRTLAASTPVPHQNNLQRAVQLIEAAEKPVILAGKGAYGAREALLEFAEKINAPIVLSLLGKGTIPDRHPLNLGQHGQIGTKPAFEAVMDTDLLLFIGTSFPYRGYLPDDVRSIQIEIMQDRVGGIYPVTEGLCGDTKEILPMLTERISEKENTDFLETYQEKMKRWHAHVDDEKNKREGSLYGPQVIGAVENNMQDDAVVSCDVGNVTVWTSRFLYLTRQHFLLSGGLATIGIGLPGAIASQLAYPDKQVVAICGDGGFAQVMQDFVTAVKYDLPIKVIILNNSKIGMIKYEQQETGNVDYETDLGAIDFAGFAENCGGEGHRVDKQADLDTTMQQAFLSAKPAIIDVVTEDMAPLPGKITYDQAVSYGEFLIKDFFLNKKIEFPDPEKTLRRLF